MCNFLPSSNLGLGVDSTRIHWTKCRSCQTLVALHQRPQLIVPVWLPQFLSKGGWHSLHFVHVNDIFQTDVAMCLGHDMIQFVLQDYGVQHANHQDGICCCLCHWCKSTFQVALLCVMCENTTLLTEFYFLQLSPQHAYIYDVHVHADRSTVTLCTASLQFVTPIDSVGASWIAQLYRSSSTAWPFFPKLKLNNQRNVENSVAWTSSCN